MSSQNADTELKSVQLYDLFEEALELCATGVSYEAVLLKCPPQLRDELRQQLDWATRLQVTASAMAKPRNQAKRVTNRNAFINEIRAINDEGKKRAKAAPSIFDSIGDAIRDFLQSLVQRTPQFSPSYAPFVALIALLLFGTLGIGTASASALPGDSLYPVKEFVRETRESIATGAAKEEIIEQNELARREDNQQAAVNRQKPITVTQELRFYQKGDSVWDIGGQTVLPGYPSDVAGQPDTTMELHGDPQPGDQVRLTYLIIPGKPNLVYGVRLEVLPKEEIAAPVENEEVPVATPTSALIYCEPTPPAGWSVYRIKKNDILGALAIKTGSSVQEIMRVNCRQTDLIVAGGTLYLPNVSGLNSSSAPVYSIPTSTAVPVIQPAVTATAEEGITPEVEPTATTEPTIESTPTEEDVVPTVEEDSSTPTTEAEETTESVEATIEETPAPTLEEGGEDSTPTSEATDVPATTEGETPEAEPTFAEEATAQPTAIFPTVTPTPIIAEETTPVADDPTSEPTSIPVAPTVQSGGEVEELPTAEATDPVPTETGNQEGAEATDGNLVDSSSEDETALPPATDVAVATIEVPPTSEPPAIETAVETPATAPDDSSEELPAAVP